MVMFVFVVRFLAPNHPLGAARTAFCSYRIKMATDDGSPTPWLTICDLARTRVVMLCNLFQYLRYISQASWPCNRVCCSISVRTI